MTESAAGQAFDPRDVEALTGALIESFGQIYGAERPMPLSPLADPAPLPEEGLGAAGIGDLWRAMVEGGTKLASPWMIGHMDTAPHPVAALTDALVSALNNNLLFRELSPFASRVEEAMIADFARRMGLPEDTPGVFASGGSLTNLTALFAAVGGYGGGIARDQILLALPDSGHTSLTKAAAVLGFAPRNIVKVDTDPAGRLLPEALDATLRASALPHKIVVAVLGGTVTGAVDDLVAVGAVAGDHRAWLHVDAVYGGALAFSRRHRHFLAGLHGAQSVALGPQKWLYTPRLSSLVIFPGSTDFDDRLAVPMPYSAGGETHRGTWGLQGSRRADALTLWVALSVIGTKALVAMIDRSIDLAQSFHELLLDHPLAEPLHAPDLNLQAFRLGAPDRDGRRLLALQDRLARQGRAWVSVSKWRDEFALRTVLLSPATTVDHLEDLLASLHGAPAG